MKVTIQSVADQAGVSIGTVSRVLNRDPSVNPKLSEKVLNSVEELGYKPLRKRRPRSEATSSCLSRRTIGLLTLGMDSSLSHLPVVTAAIDGIREAIGETGANLQICDVPDPAVEPKWLKQVQCDGWLVKGAMQGDLMAATHPELRNRLERSPCVWFHGRPNKAPGFGVGPNDWEVGTIAATHLFENGHRDVAFLSPKKDQYLLKRRQYGFVARCDDLGMRCSVHARNLQNWTFPLERPKSLTAVSSLLERLLNSKGQPTAIFVPADSIAVLLYRALAERGLSIPDDISVISSNHEEGLIASLFPALTTVDIHSTEIGRESVALLERSFRQEADLPPQDVQFAPSLIEGDSVRSI